MLDGIQPLPAGVCIYSVWQKGIAPGVNHSSQNEFVHASLQLIPRTTRTDLESNLARKQVVRLGVGLGGLQGVQLGGVGRGPARDGDQAVQLRVHDVCGGRMLMGEHILAGRWVGPVGWGREGVEPARVCEGRPCW